MLAKQRREDRTWAAKAQRIKYGTKAYLSGLLVWGFVYNCALLQSAKSSIGRNKSTSAQLVTGLPSQVAHTSEFVRSVKGIIKRIPEDSSYARKEQSTR